MLIAGILLALAVDRWNQDRLDRIETAQIVERLRSDTARNLAMFEESLALMERNLANVKALFRALESGTMVEEDPAHIEAAIKAVGEIAADRPVGMATAKATNGS